MKLIIISTLVFLAFSCQSNLISEEEETKGKPSKEFIDFTRVLNSKGMYSDTLRVSKVTSYGFGKATFIAGIPFYYLNYEDTHIANVKTATVPSVFSKAESVWAYFYRKDKKEDMVVDGVIEQWSFPGETDAKEASDAIQKNGDEIFFNTTPYSCVKGKVLYIFHTRAMAFSFPQKEVFEDFKRELQAD